MFGELTRWNPSQELSNWHRDIDDLFSRFFERPETSLGGWVPRIETYRKDNEYDSAEKPSWYFVISIE